MNSPGNELFKNVLKLTILSNHTLAPKSHLVSGKEVVFFEMEWPGFEPRTLSIRRGRSIHSTTPHLANAARRVVQFIVRNTYLAGGLTGGE